MKNNTNSCDISIIVPIYNAEKYLEKCLDSLVNQSKKEIEIILVNDGSTDGSEEIIKKYDDERIKYFKNPNSGIGKTRNFGIKKATGKYLMFVDSDDYITLDCCSLFFDYAEKTESDMVVSDFYKDKEGSLELIKVDSFKSSSLKDNNELLLKINLGPCNKIYKRSLIVENNIEFSEKYKYEDVPFVVECINKAKKISKIDEPLSFYVIHSNSETTTRDKKVFDILKIVELVRKEIMSNNSEELNKYLDTLTVDIITNYTIQQRYQKDKKIRNDFIDKAFNYLEENVPDYKNKKYYKNKSSLRRKIESSKRLTRIYCAASGVRYR